MLQHINIHTMIPCYYLRARLFYYQDNSFIFLTQLTLLSLFDSKDRDAGQPSRRERRHHQKASKIRFRNSRHAGRHIDSLPHLSCNLGQNYCRFLERKQSYEPENGSFPQGERLLSLVDMHWLIRIVRDVDRSIFIQ
jgi:hypothetical protein